MLEVEVEGAPKAVKWYKNGDQLKDAKAEDLGNGKYRLTIPDVSNRISILLYTKRISQMLHAVFFKKCLEGKLVAILCRWKSLWLIQSRRVNVREEKKFRIRGLFTAH